MSAEQQVRGPKVAKTNTAMDAVLEWHNVESVQAEDGTKTLYASLPADCRDRWDVLGICNAYESGVGHGKQRRTLKNPYSEGSDCWNAYAYGVSEGNRMAGEIEQAKLTPT
ncbi:hypothetical protein [Nevskia ramosa]|uniref:hypothetical protein n=1 Tax=Nevskia ramosa TaxID=64002 RepID=UPI003D12E7EB